MNYEQQFKSAFGGLPSNNDIMELLEMLNLFKDMPVHEVTRTCPFSREVNTRQIRFRDEDYAAWEAGKPIQSALPYMSADDREFILSGITPETWAELFPED